jgi:hypothetical protein
MSNQHTRNPIPAPERFWAKVQQGDGCWLWTGARRTRKGAEYGRFSPSPGQIVGAHRYAYELAHGPVPAGMCVLHRCDVPGCVRVDHLFLGTQRDNVLDAARKGRFPTGDRHPMRRRPWATHPPRGAAHPMTHLSDGDVRAIRAAAAAGVRQRVLAARYGLSEAAISLLVHRKTWQHVP